MIMQMERVMMVRTLSTRTSYTRMRWRDSGIRGSMMRKRKRSSMKKMMVLVNSRRTSSSCSKSRMMIAKVRKMMMKMSSNRSRLVKILRILSLRR
jgi:hypothetical protein